MSSGGLVLGDVVLPSGSIGRHGSVDDVDEVALQDPACAAGAFGRFVTGQECLGGGMEAFLDDGCGVEDAVQAAVASAVESVAFVVGGVDRDRCAAGVAGEFGRAGEAGDVSDLGDQDRCGDVADPRDLQQCRGQRSDEFLDRRVQVADAFVEVGYLGGEVPPVARTPAVRSLGGV
jgi:hypothetical protein